MVLHCQLLSVPSEQSTIVSHPNQAEAQGEVLLQLLLLLVELQLGSPGVQKPLLRLPSLRAAGLLAQEARHLLLGVRALGLPVGPAA